MMWTIQESVRLEVAIETIGHVMAIKSADIAEEERRPTPDRARIEQLTNELSALHQRIWSLSVLRQDEIEQAIAEFAPIVRQERRLHALQSRPE